jgi:IS1 family transposase
VQLQADEIKTIVGSKEESIWIFAVIEVWSRLWPSTVVDKRSYQNTLSVFRNLSSRMNFEQIPLVVTDGFGFYEKVVRRVFGPACLYGRVIKTRRNDRIVKVERRAMLGDRWRLEQALQASEDSVRLDSSDADRDWRCPGEAVRAERGTLAVNQRGCHNLNYSTLPGEWRGRHKAVSGDRQRHSQPQNDEDDIRHREMTRRKSQRRVQPDNAS